MQREAPCESVQVVPAVHRSSPVILVLLQPFVPQFQQLRRKRNSAQKNRRSSNQSTKRTAPGQLARNAASPACSCRYRHCLAGSARDDVFLESHCAVLVSVYGLQRHNKCFNFSRHFIPPSDAANAVPVKLGPNTQHRTVFGLPSRPVWRALQTLVLIETSRGSCGRTRLSVGLSGTSIPRRFAWSMYSGRLMLISRGLQ
jgi:hypothetical protein